MRMVKIAASFVLASLKASTYELYASAFRLLRPCWATIFDHPPA